MKLVVEMKQETHQRTFTFIGFRHIKTKAILTVFDLENIQPLLDIDFQEVKNFVRRKMMPVFTKQGVHRNIP